ncbi:MAG TPA: methyltransferase [Cyclobacteriaceae bacterium]|nr:methyltransferase [Cyclobacteriaceae bacterium]
MRKRIKSIAGKVLIPLTNWYLRRDRSYQKDNIQITVISGVFHPGLFSSTAFLYNYLKEHDLKNKSFLELGCGSGFLSIAAALAGAKATASDLSSLATKNTEINCRANEVDVEIILSDVFSNIPVTPFDWIIINPPYYQGSPANEKELAWYCGEDFDYFKKLFSSLKKYVHEETNVVMVLTLGCDLQRIFYLAKYFGYEFQLLKEKAVLFDERDFLYRIRPVSSFALNQA